MDTENKNANAGSDVETARKTNETNVEIDAQTNKEIEQLKKQLEIVTRERDEANNTLRTMNNKPIEKKLKFDEIFGGN